MCKRSRARKLRLPHPLCPLPRAGASRPKLSPHQSRASRSHEIRANEVHGAGSPASSSCCPPISSPPTLVSCTSAELDRLRSPPRPPPGATAAVLNLEASENPGRCVDPIQQLSAARRNREPRRSRSHRLTLSHLSSCPFLVAPASPGARRACSLNDQQRPSPRPTPSPPLLLVPPPLLVLISQPAPPPPLLPATRRSPQAALARLAQQPVWASSTAAPTRATRARRASPSRGSSRARPRRSRPRTSTPMPTSTRPPTRLSALGATAPGCVLLPLVLLPLSRSRGSVLQQVREAYSLPPRAQFSFWVAASLDPAFWQTGASLIPLGLSVGNAIGASPSPLSSSSSSSRSPADSSPLSCRHRRPRQLRHRRAHRPQRHDRRQPPHPVPSRRSRVHGLLPLVLRRRLARLPVAHLVRRRDGTCRVLLRARCFCERALTSLPPLPSRPPPLSRSSRSSRTRPLALSPTSPTSPSIFGLDSTTAASP